MGSTQEELEQRLEAYMKDRLEQYASWYDAKAVKMKTNYMRSRVIAAVGAVTIPVLSNIALSVTISGFTIDVPRFAITIIGFVVALLLALEGVLHYREQWQNYRTTEQFLGAQRYLFTNRVGEYANLEDEDAFKQLVTRVESAIKNENEVTLNVLARADSTSIKPN